PDREAPLDHDRLRAAEDALGQDHAPAAQGRRGEPRGRRRHHPRRLLRHGHDPEGHDRTRERLIPAEHGTGPAPAGVGPAPSRALEGPFPRPARRPPPPPGGPPVEWLPASFYPPPPASGAV